MQLNFRNNYFGYFRFYYSVLRIRLIYCLALSVLVSILDGLGLSMLIPLLSLVSGNSSSGEESMGSLQFMLRFVNAAGFKITLESILVTMLVIITLKGVLRFLELKCQT